MALVADLMTVPQNTWGLEPGKILSVGVGPAYEIYVAYPVGDQLVLGRGGVFSYREFLSDRRLTDEEWQGMVKEEKGYGIPSFMEELVTEEKPAIPNPYLNY